MKRAPLKRTAFKPKAPLIQPRVEREPKPLAALTRSFTYEGTTSGEPVEKENASQSGAYIAAAKAIGRCMNCHLTGPLEFCHRDQGKGFGIKTDVREGWPGCHVCHGLFGGHNGGGRMQREERRERELELARRTRAAILAAGNWPKNLPLWKEKETQK